MEQLGLQFQELSRVLSAGSGAPDPDRLVAFAASAVPHGEGCGLTLTRGSGRPATVASSGPVAVQVDKIQYESGEGPCLEAAEGHDLVRVGDLGTDQQWPEFARRCVAETGIHNIFSVRLALPGGDRAALNFYAHRPDSLDDLDVGTGALLGPFAALAVRTAMQQRQLGQLETALNSSRQIGTAVGILMARRLVTAEKAFDLLVGASQHLNRKLRDVAVEVEETGTLPQRPAPRRPGPRR